jgi:hypothetical protein
MSKNGLAQPLRTPHDSTMRKRPHVLSVTLSAEELAQFQALARGFGYAHDRHGSRLDARETGKARQQVEIVRPRRW